MVKIAKKRGNLEKIILIPLIVGNILACNSVYAEDKKLKQESKPDNFAHYSQQLNKKVEDILNECNHNTNKDYEDKKENFQNEVEYRYFIMDINGKNKREITLADYEELKRDALEARAQEKEQEKTTTEYSLESSE